MAFPFCFWCPRQLLLLIFFILQGKTYRIFILKVLFLSLYCVRQVRVKFYYFCFLGVYSYANLNLEESRVRSSAKVISSSFVFKPNLISAPHQWFSSFWSLWAPDIGIKTCMVHPCFNPVVTWNQPDASPSIRTAHWNGSYRSFTILMSLSGMQ